VEKNQDLALRADSAVLARTKTQLTRRNRKVALLPWLQRVGLHHPQRGKVRTAATDLTLASSDLCLSRH
jgi:hypothetical protein